MIRLLEWCENEAKWPVLRQALRDPSPLVRSAAPCQSGPLNRDALLEATADEYRLVRLEAASAHSLRPNDPKYAYTLAFYQAKKGDLSGAVGTL